MGERRASTPRSNTSCHGFHDSNWYTSRRGKMIGQQVCKVKAETCGALERIGRERVAIYKTLVLTDLRRGELKQLRWSDLDLDNDQAWLTVRASVSKNGKKDTLPIRGHLADELRRWREECPTSRDSHREFNVPRGLAAVLNRDLVAAGIARRVKDEHGRWQIEKKDAQGRTIDVHALRQTTASHSSKAGVALRTAQAIMRHSDIRLTLGTYTDPRVLDTAGALNALPSLAKPQDHEGDRHG